MLLVLICLFLFATKSCKFPSCSMPCVRKGLCVAYSVFLQRFTLPWTLSFLASFQLCPSWQFWHWFCCVLLSFLSFLLVFGKLKEASSLSLKVCPVQKERSGVSLTPSRHIPHAFPTHPDIPTYILETLSPYISYRCAPLMSSKLLQKNARSTQTEWKRPKHTNKELLIPVKLTFTAMAPSMSSRW